MTIGPATPPVERWWRRFDVVRIHDGDTLEVDLDLGFDTWTRKPIRLYGINAPELNNPDGSGKRALQYVVQWIGDHAPHGTYMAQFTSWDKYAPRFDGVLVCGQGHCLNDAMLAAGMAVPEKV